jgi:hypothetical protein
MAKEVYHDLVKRALQEDGWVITDDPLQLYLGKKRVAVDLAAEMWIIAEKELRKIAVEVKSFTSMSLINELHHAVGQIRFYELLLKKQEPNRILYLAMPEDAYDELIVEPVIQEFLQLNGVKLIIYDTFKANIVTWIN